LLTTGGSHIAAPGAYDRLPNAGQRLPLHRFPRAAQVRHSDTAVSAHRHDACILATARCRSRWLGGSDRARAVHAEHAALRNEADDTAGCAAAMRRHFITTL